MTGAHNPIDVYTDGTFLFEYLQFYDETPHNPSSWSWLIGYGPGQVEFSTEKNPTLASLADYLDMVETIEGKDYIRIILQSKPGYSGKTRLVEIHWFTLGGTDFAWELFPLTTT